MGVGSMERVACSQRSQGFMTPYVAYSVLGSFQGEKLSKESLRTLGGGSAEKKMTGAAEWHYTVKEKQAATNIPPLFLEIEWLSFMTDAKLHRLFLCALCVNS